ncbi:MAG: UvrD-helicase domain-containing protein [Pirellulaceae bacterium]|nr:UvrD-helicase domain-containing protein [Pirellulaceae bacterium]
MADTPFRTSPSAIARYFFHDCERFLRFHAAGAELQRKEGIPKREFDHSPLVKALLESGYAWEQTVLEQHMDGPVFIATGDGPCHTRRFDWQETQELLRTAKPGSYVYQPTLHLPAAFYERYGIDPTLVTISDNHPDLIAIVGDEDGHRRFHLIDLKRGESLQLTHRVQVLLYAMELDTIVRDQRIDDAQVDLQIGSVWLGSQPEPTACSLGELRPHLENFLRYDLIRILRGSVADAHWHVHSRCEWCEFFRYCWSEMQRNDDLSRLSQLTPWGKRFLWDRVGVRTTNELGQFLQEPEANDVLGRCASLAGRGPRLAEQVAALDEGKPHSHGAASPSLSRGENIGLFLTLQQEPLGDSVYLAGIYVTIRNDLRRAVFSDEVRARLFEGRKSQPFVLVAERPAAVEDMRRQWVHLLHEIVVQVHNYNDGRDWKDQLSLQAYVPAEQERALLVSWLLDSLRDPELAEEAMTLLFHFQAPELLVANEHPDREVPFPLVVLLDALGHVLALPVEVSYTLPEALDSLGSRFKLRRNDYHHFPLGPGMRAEPIHAAWYRGKTDTVAEIADQGRTRLQAMWALLQGVRHHAKDAIFTWSAKFTLPTREPYADPLLSRLAFFARYESLLRCLETRNQRCEPRPVQFLLGKTLELEALDGDRFAITGGTMEIEPGGFPEWLLVTDGEAGRRTQLEFRDYASRAKMWQGRKQKDLALVGITDVERDELGTPTGLTVKIHQAFDGDGPEPGQRFLLHSRFTDFTTDRVVKFLRTAGAKVHELFLRCLRDPAEASESRALPKRVQRLANDETTIFHLTESQQGAFRAICRQRVVPVWGPPGTGKTHFLAAAVLALASAHARTGKPFSVLATAFTHAAIENLLRKIASLRQALGEAAISIGKVKYWQGEDNGEVEIVDESCLCEWLDEHPQAVVGATVYSSLKKFDELPPFDLVVIDEASQVRVPEAAVPIGLVGPKGRLVLAGDHLQLPPIVVGAYPETPPEEPILHRSIFETIASRSRLPSGTSLARGQSCRASRSLPAEGTYLPSGTSSTQSIVPADSAPPNSIVHQLTENFRMNDVLTSFAAELLYGTAYRSFDGTVAQRRLNLPAERSLDPFVEACLDPQFPLVFVVLDGVWAARENPLEAELVARLVTGLRGTLRRPDHKLYDDDATFFREGVFVVSPHRAQIRTIRRELRRGRMWQSPPLVDTVDKMQGQEADAVIVSYGVSDPEFAMAEAEFIYGLNRLNVAITRARSKCIVCLPRPLLDAPPQVLDVPEATRGLAYMRALIEAVAGCGDEVTFDLDNGARATVYRARDCFVGVQPSGCEDRLKPGLQPDEPARNKVVQIADEELKREVPAPDRAPTTPPPKLDALLARLNDQQREAACHGHDPLLIVAGAGTGKTTTLVHRVAWLIAQGTPAERILLLTFTRRAAGEMVRRVADVLDEAEVSRRVWGGTFHGTGLRLLRQYGKAIDVNTRFTIHDQGDAEDLMGLLCREFELGADDKKFPKKRACLAIHSYGAGAELPLEEVLRSQFSQHEKYAKPLRELFQAYSERKADLNVFDYDDLLLRWCELLEHEQVGKAIRDRFDCVLVDEYQDTNRLQARLLKSLCPDGRGLTVVGDDAQSIYSFRAATVRNILDFPDQFPGTRVVSLEQNYRSTQPILAATNGVIAEARERYAKDLWSERSGGPQPQLITCYDEHEQVEFVVGRILQHQKMGVCLSQQAVLFRASHHSIALEAELARHNLEFVKYGGLKFVESAHVKDLMSILRLAENPRDVVSGQRVLCLLPGVGPKKASGLLRDLTAADWQFDAWSDVKVPAKSKECWPDFVTLMRWLAGEAAAKDLSGQVHRVLKFYEPFLQDNYENADQRLADLEQLEGLATRFADRTTLLADLTVDPPTSTAELPRGAAHSDPLVLSTMHSAKGLEWSVVYVLHATDGKIPWERSLIDPEQLEEERRLFYVALTRAADCLYVCHAQRESSSYGNKWLGDVYERRELTRFVTKPVKQTFQSQQASRFEEPDDSQPPKKRPRKARKKAARKARR